MKIKLSIILQSHLSDALIEMNHDHETIDTASVRIKFCKYLLWKYPNTEIEIDPDEEYKQFQQP